MSKKRGPTSDLTKSNYNDYIETIPNDSLKASQEVLATRKILKIVQKQSPISINHNQSPLKSFVDGFNTDENIIVDEKSLDLQSNQNYQNVLDKDFTIENSNHDDTPLSRSIDIEEKSCIKIISSETNQTINNIVHTDTTIYDEVNHSNIDLDSSESFDYEIGLSNSGNTDEKIFEGKSSIANELKKNNHLIEISQSESSKLDQSPVNPDNKQSSKILASTTSKTGSFYDIIKETSPLIISLDPKNNSYARNIFADLAESSTKEFLLSSTVSSQSSDSNDLAASARCIGEKKDLKINDGSTVLPKQDQTIVFKDPHAKLYRFKRSNKEDSGEWTSPIFGIAEILRNELDMKSCHLLTFHQSGSLRLLLNMQIFSNLRFVFSKNSAVTFSGFRLEDPSKSCCYRLVFSSEDFSNNFMNIINSITHNP